MRLKTEDFKKLKKALTKKKKEEETKEVNMSMTLEQKGEKVFNQYCSACHKPKDKLVGPPITEMASIYKDNKSGLQNWIKNRGKKRPDYPQMPGFETQLEQDQLDQLSAYILTIK